MATEKLPPARRRGKTGPFTLLTHPTRTPTRRLPSCSSHPVSDCIRSWQLWYLLSDATTDACLDTAPNTDPHNPRALRQRRIHCGEYLGVSLTCGHPEYVAATQLTCIVGIKTVPNNILRTSKVCTVEQITKFSTRVMHEIG